MTLYDLKPTNFVAVEASGKVSRGTVTRRTKHYADVSWRDGTQVDYRFRLSDGRVHDRGYEWTIRIPTSEDEQRWKRKADESAARNALRITIGDLDPMHMPIERVRRLLALLAEEAK